MKSLALKDDASIPVMLLRQPIQLEWDMKLWWPNNEAIYGTLLAYALTNEKKYEDWFEKLHGWAIKHFTDKKYGEWIGYLHRDGSLALALKGNYFKGVPSTFPGSSSTATCCLKVCWKRLIESYRESPQSGSLIRFPVRALS